MFKRNIDDTILAMNWSRRRGSMRLLFLAVSIVLFFLLAAFTYVGARIIRLKDLSLQSMVVLTEWNALDRATKEILISRSTVTLHEESVLPQLQENLISRRHAFENALEELEAAQSLSDLDLQWAEKIDDANFVWNYTKRNLLQAEGLLDQIIEQKLLEPLPIGLLQMVYSQGHRDVYNFDDIILLMNFVNQLSIIDISSNEFSRVIGELNQGIQDDVASEVKRVLFISILLTSIVISVSVALFFLVKRLKNAEDERARFEQEHLQHLLSGMLLSEDLWEESLDQLREMSLNIDINDPVAIVVLRISLRASHAATTEQGSIEIGLLRALTVLQEHNDAKKLRMMSTQIDEDLVLIINVPGELVIDQDRYRRWIRMYTQKTIDLLKKEAALVFSATIGKPIDLGLDAVAEYAHVTSAACHRFILGASAVFFSDEVVFREDDSDFTYPFEQEHRLGEMIKRGHYSDAKSTFAEILNTASNRGYSALRLTILQGALTITSALATIERNLGMSDRTDALDVTSRLNTAETLQEVREFVCLLIDDFADRVEYHRSHRNERLNLEVSEFIESSYRDPNLSADIIAEKMGLSTSYLGRLYRKRENHSISDAINQRRLDEAARMLSETDQSISDIARAVGVTNLSYFFTLFRKQYGVTPRGFRSRSQKLS